MGCNCGCNTCETKALTLNESVAPKSLLSEGLKYHIDNNRPLTEHLYRAGSKEYFNLFSEARDLYSRNIINLSGDDLEIINETHLGHFGVLENKAQVPLDYPMLCEGEKMKLKDITWEKVKEFFPNSYQQPKDEKDDPSREYYSYYDSISFPEPNDSLISVEHRNMLDYWKEITFKKYGNVDVEFNPNEVWFNKVKVIDDEFSKDQEIYSKGKQAWIDGERKKGRTSGLDEISNKILDEVKKRYHINEAKKYKKGDKLKVKLKNGKEFDITFDSYSSNKGIAYGKIDGDRKPFSLDAVVSESVNEAVEFENRSYDSQLDTVAQEEFGMDYNQLGSNEQEWVRDEIDNRLYEAKKKKKKDPPIGKPTRSSSGGKAYKVYVRDPKTKNIKTVRFGSGGLRAKINNSKARAAFSKRHDCPNKKDRTKASYWSCRLPRYAKLLGLKSSFSGFW